MSVTVTITEEARDMALRYGKNVSQGIIAMGEEMTKGIKTPAVSPVSGLPPEMKAAIEEAFDKKLKPMLEKYERGQQVVNAEFMKFLSSGQGAVKVPSTEAYGFTRASALKSGLKEE